MRWTKLLRDVRAERGRTLLMLAAVGFALLAVTTMLGAYGIVTREAQRNYLLTNPASATLDVDAVTPEMLAAARAFPGIADAEARSVVEARVNVGGEWMRMLLFVVEDFGAMRLNLFRPVSGAWPPPDGTILLERMAVGLIGASEGQSVILKTAGGAAVEAPVSGVVHDTTLAPAWQEQSGYGYLSMATFAALGEPPVFRELRVLVAGSPTQAEIDAAALELAAALQAQGFAVHAVKAPPAGQHPHQGQIASGLMMFLSLAVLALVLAAFLVAAVLAATLARQVREVGVMKAVGARSGQIAAMYLAALLALGATALVIGLPPGLFAAGVVSDIMAETMNFVVADRTVPAWVYAAVVAAGLLLPVIAALPAIAGASRVTVRAALAATGVARVSGGGLLDRAAAAIGGFGPAGTLALRNALRRRGRLLLALALLATGSALFVAALSAREGWRAMAATALTDRHYDVEFRFAEPVADRRLAEVLARSGAVQGHELWGMEQTAYAREGALEVMRTYPDRGHGSFAILGVPPATQLVTLPVIEGRWLLPDDDDALVLTQQSHRAGLRFQVGDRLSLSLGGRPTSWTLVGIVREIGGGGAYVNRASYDRLAGPDAGRMVRLVLAGDGPEEKAASLAAVERALAEAGLAVERAIPITTLYLALAGHVEVPVTMLVSAALLLVLIGGLGLASMTAISVVERTREIGIMKALGAVPAVIVRMIVGEAVLIAVLSWVAGLVLALPLIAGIGLLGATMFGSPLPFILSLPAAAAWLGLLVVIAMLASAVPAWRASRLVVRQALTYT